MESSLVDQAVLGQFVDALIGEKYPNQPNAVSDGARKDAIRALDYQILKAILGSLTKEQGGELSQLLKKEDSDEATFENFFKSHNIDLENVIKSVMTK
ncbi:hypothetical protein IKD60_02000, partial [Candidatus Saccharibacteria bacterium]|nr:hypothetical protein [Candidatus Saccharibacteria bacterium]